MNLDDPSDGEDQELFATAQAQNLTRGCVEIAAVQVFPAYFPIYYAEVCVRNEFQAIKYIKVRDVSDPTGNPNQTLEIDPQVGAICRDAHNQPEGCVDYEVRFCCEGCCPLLNVSGDPELTEYYENYPGIYELQTDTHNEMITYKQRKGYNDAGVMEYGQGLKLFFAKSEFKMIFK